MKSKYMEYLYKTQQIFKGSHCLNKGSLLYPYRRK